MINRGQPIFLRAYRWRLVTISRVHSVTFLTWAVFACSVILFARCSAANEINSHWALQPIRRPQLPAVGVAMPEHGPIDRFIQKRLRAEGLRPSPSADRSTLIRRVTLDLTGLPPSPAQVASFLSDSRPSAYECLIDRLLASPYYGEKRARHWMDLCHYADSDGYLTDQLRPVAWRYRHWLVEALNADLPFDQFTIEQLAGDLLPECSIEQQIATGFLRQTLSNREGGAGHEEFRVEQVVDRVQMAGTIWLGLTVGCSRCHDHKYDPLLQNEFYQLYAIFDNTDEINIDAPLPGELKQYLLEKPEYDRKRAEMLAPLAEQIAELQARWEEKLLYTWKHRGESSSWDRQWEVLGLVWGGGLGEGQLEGVEIVKLPAQRRSQLQKDRILDYFLANGAIIDEPRWKELKLKELREKLEELRAELPQLTRAPTMLETPNPRQTYVHLRGNFRTRGDDVQSGLPECLPRPENVSHPDRLSFAEWLCWSGNPLTSRVAVNRMWQELFGNGFVRTPDDFGTRGSPPSHPELLDWLAVDFMDQGWSSKAMLRQIIGSATYRQSSRTGPDLQSRDPANILLARQSGLRFSSEQVRDSILFASGLLSRKLGGPSVRPPQPDSVVIEGFENKWVLSGGEDRHRRGLYTFIQRTSPFAQGVTFDAANAGRTCTRRERSNTPLQALTLLNDPVFFEAAQAMALRILHENEGDDTERIDFAFQLCLSRVPGPTERERLLAYLQEQREIFKDDPQAVDAIVSERTEGPDKHQWAAWTAVASVLLNLHEFITRE